MYDFTSVEKGKVIETKRKLEVTRNWERRLMRGYCLVGRQLLFGVIKLFWK